MPAGLSGCCICQGRDGSQGVGDTVSELNTRNQELEIRGMTTGGSGVGSHEYG